MNDVLGRVILLALGVAMSPVPIVAVLVILLTRRARIGSLVLAGSWVLGNAVAILVAVAFAGKIPPPREGFDLPFEGLILFLLGVGLIVAAVLSRRGRFKSEDPFSPPAWVTAVDELSPVGGALVTFTNATTSPKNLALAIAAGLVISDAWVLPSQRVPAELIYIAVASMTVLAPVVTYFVGGTRSVETLERWKRAITARAAGVMELTLFILGLVLAAKGLYNLAGVLA